MKKRALHVEIQIFPHKTIFRIEPRLVQRISTLSVESILDLHTKEDLEEVMSSIFSNGQ